MTVKAKLHSLSLSFMLPLQGEVNQYFHRLRPCKCATR